MVELMDRLKDCHQRGTRVTSTPKSKQQNPTVKQPLTKYKNKIKRSVKVLVVNCRSIVDNKNEYENRIHSTKPDIVVGTESWLKPKHYDNETKGIHHFVETGLAKLGGGGILIDVRNDIIAQEMKDIQSDCEDLWIKLNLFGSKSLLIWGIL
ncbi:hypothetical protein MAR_024637 [Mya arenaria]|uniref:Endonuclease/exonuclease/phosphatase domain-containing protein n=1 Tax=Mya arenaria TaxID=6604 RepID=A0ABY7DUG8_MYAAR|nr:hypothetical protein MAR_024637 [Mya arenaria]